jgi:hypothetical protein
VGRDELLPREAIGAQSCGDRVSIPVAIQHVPGTVAAGQRIDVYATVKGGQTERVLHAVPVQAVQRSRSALSASSEWAVVVRVPPAAATAVVRAVRTAELDLIVVDTPSGQEPCGAAEPPPSPTPSGKP